MYRFCQDQPAGAAGAELAATFPLLIADPVSERFVALGTLPLPMGLVAGGVELVSGSDPTTSAVCANFASMTWPSSASAALALDTSLSSCNLYRCAADEVYCRTMGTDAG